MKRTILAALAVALAAPVGAQINGGAIKYTPPPTAAFTGGAITSALLAPAADNCTAPPYSFTGQTTSGLCSPAAGTVALRIGGANILSVAATGASISNLANSQLLYLVKTTDATDTNYERLEFGHGASYTYIRSASGGTGTTRNLNIAAASGIVNFGGTSVASPSFAAAATLLQPNTDNAASLGQASRRFTTLYLAQSTQGGIPPKALTDNTATVFATMAIPQTAGANYGGGEIVYTIFCKDATKQATESGTVIFACQNLAGTESCVFGTPANVISTDGTASFVAPVFTATAGADLVNILVQSDCTGVTPTTHTIQVRFDLQQPNTLAFP